MRKIILITGSTGTVGSVVAPLLKKRGYDIVHLVRGDNEVQARKRLSRFMELDERDMVLRGDVTLIDCGIQEKYLKKLKGKITKILHCAASVKFDQSLLEAIYLINLQGTKNVLDLAEKLKISEFHHISTAYVAGDMLNFSEQDTDLGQIGRNPYESSKLEAEEMVRQKFNGNFSIYRLGIVVGDSTSGEISSFAGYYGFFIGFYRLLQQKLLENGSLKNGIDFTADGYLNLPLQFRCSSTSTLNLVTVDWLSKILTELVDFSAKGETFHLTHPNPPRVQWVIKESLKILGIKGLQFVSEVDFSKLTGSLLTQQKIFSRNFRRYQPYALQEAKFDRSYLEKKLKDRPDLLNSLPEINFDFLKLLLEYAVKMDFGRAKTTEIEEAESELGKLLAVK